MIVNKIHKEHDSLIILKLVKLLFFLHTKQNPLSSQSSCYLSYWESKTEIKYETFTSFGAINGMNNKSTAEQMMSLKNCKDKT